MLRMTQVDTNLLRMLRVDVGGAIESGDVNRTKFQFVNEKD